MDLSDECIAILEKFMDLENCVPQTQHSEVAEDRRKEVNEGVDKILDRVLDLYPEREEERWYSFDEWLAQQQQQRGGGEAEHLLENDQQLYTDDDERIIVEQVRETEVKQFGTKGSVFKIRFQNVDEVEDISELVKKAFEKCMNAALGDDTQSNALIGVQIDHPALSEPIIIPFTKPENLTAEMLVREIEKVQQSRKEFTIDEEFEMTITRIQAPQGTGTKRKFKGNFEIYADKMATSNSATVKIANNDELCLARALVTAKARLERHSSEENRKLYETVRQGDKRRGTKQKQLAKQLMNEAGLAGHAGPCGLTEIQQIQTVLTDYQIKIYSKDKYFTCWFRGPTKEKVLNLLHHDNHYDVLTSMAAFFEKSYWCESCEKGYYHEEEHHCEKICLCCFSSPPCISDGGNHNCTDCNRVFANADCFAKHKTDDSQKPGGKKKQKKTPVCERVKRCATCKCLLKNKQIQEQHRCGYWYCRLCAKQVEIKNHKCYMQVLKPPKKPKAPKFLFFDFETVQDEQIGQNEVGPIYRHQPNCVIAIKVCAMCWRDPEKPCDNCCKEKVKICLDRTCLDEFCKFLFSEEHRGWTAIAHNARGFDSQFLLDYIQRQGVKPEIISKGLEIMQLVFQGIRVIDSLNFLPMALAKFPAAFGFDDAKGYFPHFANCFDLDTPRELPEPEAFGTKRMNPGELKKFMTWYDEKKLHMRQTGEKFILRNWLVPYCKQDVLLDLKGCMMFREIFMQCTNGVDPLLEAMTLPGAVSTVFRRNYLKENTIALVPPQGYRITYKQSLLAMKYLEWYSKTNGLSEKGLFIQHAFNQGEFQVGPYFVDGLLKEIESGKNLKKIIEVHGCYHHGCTDCYEDRKKTLVGGRTAQELYERTVERTRFLRNENYEVVEVWECEINTQLRTDPEMKDFFAKQSKFQDPIDPRDALYGGRCNATKLYHKCGPGETIKDADVCSLYPWTCKYGEFPIGHPTVITEKFQEMTAEKRPYKGLIKCRVVPPRKLFHPVLPYRSGGKLIFPLCGKCADERNQEEECKHSPQERSFWGCWVHLEVYKALELGYSIEEVSEVWHWDEWARYDRAEGTEGFFSGYVNTFLKIKAEASGWPKWAKTEQQKQQFIDSYKEREGIQLDRGKIEKNPGLRQLAKLALVSFWGKFAQRNNLVKLEYFDDPAEYFKTVYDPCLTILTVRIIGEKLAALRHKKVEEAVESFPYTNPVVGAYVTAQARLKLFSFLELLGESVCYFDTDSVVYVHKEGEPQLEVGDFLGDLTDELADYGPGAYIEEFISGGPKQYSFKIQCGEGKIANVLKLRGMTLSSETAKQLNHETLKKLVMVLMRTGAQDELPIVIEKIARTPTREVVTKRMKKVYRAVYDKRRLLKNGSTLPYGY